MVARAHVPNAKAPTLWIRRRVFYFNIRLRNYHKSFWTTYIAMCENNSMEIFVPPGAAV